MHEYLCRNMELPASEVNKLIRALGVQAPFIQVRATQVIGQMGDVFTISHSVQGFPIINLRFTAGRGPQTATLNIPPILGQTLGIPTEGVRVQTTARWQNMESCTLVLSQ